MSETPHSPSVRTAPAASSVVQFTLALTAGGGAATVYYHQPALGLLMHEFGSSAPSLIATATLFGYAAGILLLVPLGDTKPRRTLIVGQQLLLAVALMVAALAPNLAVLTVASAVAGAFATTAQQAIPFAAELAPPEARGRMVGRAMTGLLLGVLLARTASGFVAEAYGWRAVFAAAAGVTLLLAVLAFSLLPRTRPGSTLPYGALLSSIVDLVRDEPVLRGSTLIQGCIFAAFNAFWASLALHLQSASFGLGAQAAGLFGLLGAAGALVAPLSGRLSDRHGASQVVICGATIVLVGFALVAAFGGTSLTGIGVAVFVFDVGVSLAMIANQTRIYALRPEARGRINTVYMTGAFFAGGLGASLGTRGYEAGGWPAVSGVCLFFAACAVAASIATRGRSSAAIAGYSR